MATLPNCGNPLRVLTTKVIKETYNWPRVVLGYSKNVRNWAIRSQAPKSYKDMEKVQRLNGNGLRLLYKAEA